MFQESVHKVVEGIPFGSVASYGDVAALAGKPGAARQVGYIARRGDKNAPWHRVVKSNGALAAGFAWGGSDEQQRMLESEGLTFTKQGKIQNFTRHRLNTSIAEPPLIVVVGETAAGKSDISMQLAQHYNGEIICADAWTVRKKLDIGTAKPTQKDRLIVRHHLLDIVEPDGDFTAATFKELGQEAIDDISSRSKLPILVGGTFLYVDAILHNYSFMEPGDPKKREYLNNLAIEELISIAEENHFDLSGIDIRNKRRLVRLIESNGKKPTRSKKRSNVIMIGVRRSRTELRKRMEARVEKMFASGLKYEVKSIADQYGWDTEALKAIGYREWQAYFKGEQSRQETKRKIVSNTVNKLAKRQRSWFKKNPEIQWVENYEQAEALVKKFLNNK